MTDFYTGVGEVVGVHEISLMFARLNRTVQVKRARLLSFDEIPDRDVIFVGGVAENVDLRRILPPRDIAIFAGATGRGITLVNGIRPQDWMLVLAGNSTMGTQAAVEFVCRRETLTALTNRLGPDGFARRSSATCDPGSRKASPWRP